MRLLMNPRFPQFRFVGGGKFLDTHIVISLLVFVLSKYHRDKIDILMAKVHKINETSKRKAKYFLSLA